MVCSIIVIIVDVTYVPVTYVIEFNNNIFVKNHTYYA